MSLGYRKNYGVISRTETGRVKNVGGGGKNRKDD
jgi:hypothetical protein